MFKRSTIVIKQQHPGGKVLRKRPEIQVVWVSSLLIKFNVGSFGVCSFSVHNQACVIHCVYVYTPEYQLSQVIITFFPEASNNQGNNAC